MSRSPSPDSSSASPPDPPSLPVAAVEIAEADPTEAAGEATWSLEAILGMVLRKWWLLGVMAIVMATFMGYKASRQVVQYQGSFRLLVEPVEDQRELAQLTDKGDTSKRELDYSTQIEVMYSLQTLEPILKQIHHYYPDLDHKALTDKLTITRLGETKIIEISYHDKQPDQVKYVLKYLSEGYLKYRANAQKSQLQQGLAFVEDQIPKIQTKVNYLQNQTQALRKRYNFIDPDSYGENLLARLSAITQQRQAVQIDLSGLQKQMDVLTAQVATSSLNQSPNYQKLLQQYKALDQAIALESSRFTANSPNLQALLDKQARLQQLLDREANQGVTDQLTTLSAQIQVLRVREQQLLNLERSLNQQLANVPAIAHQFSDLQQEIKVAMDSLQRLQEARGRLQIQAAQNEVPWQLIAPPSPPQGKPLGSLSKALITGGMMGLALGLVLAFLLEKLDNTYYTLAALKKRLSLPILGMIPDHPQLQKLRSPLSALELELPDQELDQGTYAFIEAFRTLYANLKRLQPPPRSLVISSALPREGRTTLALHLAQAAAAMGQRVLLIDAHLRRSGTQVHTSLGLPNKEGLSQVLMAELPLEAVLQQIPWEPSLSVISMGLPPTDPTRLLGTEQVQQLLTPLTQVFDLIIFDTPPLMGLADVSLIAAATDGVLLVTSLGQRGSITALEQALERLRVAKLPVLGLIANRVKHYKVDLYR